VYCSIEAAYEAMGIGYRSKAEEDDEVDVDVYDEVHF